MHINYTKILVIGSNGLLGSQIVNDLNKRKINFLTIARNKSHFNLDLRNFKKLKYFLKKNKFTIIINCAAKVSIDFCEKNYNKALKINYLLPKYLSILSKKLRFKFVHISTDQVYAGNKFGCNSESSKIFGINKYAKMKILAENEVLKVKNNLVIRTNFTGKKLNKGNSFSDWIYKSAKKRRKIALFNDMYTSTLDAKTCSNLIVSLSTINSSGIYNLGSKNALSKKDFALLFVKKLKKKLYYYEKSCDVLKVKRVKNLSLNVTKVEKKLGLKMPSSTRAINNLIKDYK